MTVLFVFGAVWGGPVPYDGVAVLGTGAAAFLHREPAAWPALKGWLAAWSLTW
jgi:hypothetical protein